jgi:hypothetical protein
LKSAVTLPPPETIASSSSDPPDRRTAPQAATAGRSVTSADIGIELRETEAVVSKELPIGAWRQAVGGLVRSERGVQWWLGDVLLHGHQHFGLSLRELAAITGYSYGYVRNLVSTARRVPPGNRDVDVGWDVYAVAARVKDPKRQREALQEAARLGLDADELRRRLRNPPVAKVGGEPSSAKRRARGARDELWAMLLEAGLPRTGRLSNLVGDMLDGLNDRGALAVVELAERRRA